MRPKTPRLAVRAVILDDDRLLLVNAWPDGKSDLMCAPGGGVEVGSSLPENLIREVFEETGLTVEVNAPCLVNEFHDPQSEFHQVDVYFRCTMIGKAQIEPDWQDPEAIVTDRRWVTRSEMSKLRVKPDSLAAVAFGDADAPTYDPLEPLVR
ncbi:NUDIX hydrolase [Sulfitobacter sp. SK012]|uniref:NUDIX domain-containing protein n=1 Tax=Sulfitobacter sp. SK012 TaxID=1389005 RepID=UPI000E0C068D|nr:NUDIX hydrolase [Sulfitobacter sp. SK012]AXI45367.1 NUDIX hydrolase [Sulfitobacter sp. SK012]